MFSRMGSRILLGGFYLFTAYALRCRVAFRHPRGYLGIAMLFNWQFRLHRFYPVFTGKLLCQAAIFLPEIPGGSWWSLVSFNLTGAVALFL